MQIPIQTLIILTDRDGTCEFTRTQEPNKLALSLSVKRRNLVTGSLRPFIGNLHTFCMRIKINLQSLSHKRDTIRNWRKRPLVELSAYENYSHNVTHKYTLDSCCWSNGRTACFPTDKWRYLTKPTPLFCSSVNGQNSN